MAIKLTKNWNTLARMTLFLAAGFGLAGCPEAVKPLDVTAQDGQEHKILAYAGNKLLYAGVAVGEIRPTETGGYSFMDKCAGGAPVAVGGDVRITPEKDFPCAKLPQP